MSPLSGLRVMPIAPSSDVLDTILCCKCIAAVTTWCLAIAKDTGEAEDVVK